MEDSPKDSTPPKPERSTILAPLQGACFLLMGLAANPWTLGTFLWKGAVFPIWAQVLIVAVDLGLVALGVWFLLRRPPMARKAFLSLLSLFFCLLAAEVLSFATGFFTPPFYRQRHRLFYEMQEPDPELGFRNRPSLRDFKLTWAGGTVSGLYETDQAGFRNVGRDYDQAHWFVVGDSFAFGEWMPREKTFFGLLEKERGEPVVTLGVSGYDLVQYEILTRRFLSRHKPEVLLLCLFANDLRPVRDGNYLRDFYRRTGRTKYASSSIYMRSFTLQLLRLGKNLLTVTPGSRKADNGLWLYQDKGADRDYFLGGHHVEVEAILKRIVGVVLDKGVRPVVILIPSKESAHKEEFLRLFPEASCTTEERSYAAFIRIVRAAGGVCLDLTPVFRERATEEALYFARDPHWNEAGHSLAAETIRKRLP